MALSNIYDIFYSYRWGQYDSDLTDKLFDLASTHSVGHSSRAPVVFLDRERLLPGLNFKESFAKALVGSSMVVPIVSRAALAKMLQHDPNTENNVKMLQHDPNAEDNVLLEWVMALECLASPASRVQRVMPIAFDKASPVPPHAVSPFFASGLLGILSDAVPTATLARAAALLRANGVEPWPEMMALTLKGVVTKLMESLCILLDEQTANPLLYAKAASSKVMEALSGCANLADLDTIIFSNGNTSKSLSHSSSPVKMPTV